MIRHANRTTGFFKIRGVNVNHAEFEDLMFRNPEVLDFQAVLETEAATGREGLTVLIEIKGAIDEARFARTCAATSNRLSRCRRLWRCSSAARWRPSSSAASRRRDLSIAGNDEPRRRQI